MRRTPGTRLQRPRQITRLQRLRQNQLRTDDHQRPQKYLDLVRYLLNQGCQSNINPAIKGIGIAVHWKSPSRHRDTETPTCLTV